MYKRFFIHNTRNQTMKMIIAVVHDCTHSFIYIYNNINNIRNTSNTQNINFMLYICKEKNYKTRNLKQNDFMVMKWKCCWREYFLLLLFCLTRFFFSCITFKSYFSFTLNANFGLIVIYTVMPFLLNKWLT